MQSHHTLEARGFRTLLQKLRKGKRGDWANACDLSPQQGQQKPEPALETTTQSHLERLWLKAKKKLTVGDVKHFTLDPTKAVSYGATEIYGCTVLVVVDGRSVTIGHFPQESGSSITMENEQQTQKKIIGKMEENLVLADYTTRSVAYIVHSATQSSVGYRKIKEYLVNENVSEGNIHSKPYTAGLSTVGHRGKVLVTWDPKDEGGATMKVYIQNDNPIYVRDYDANGDPCELIG